MSLFEKQSDTTDNGASTNILQTSATSGSIQKNLISYRLSVSIANSVTGTNMYFGLNYYLVKSDDKAATVVTYGGDPYATHLETPGIGSASGYALASDVTALNSNKLSLTGGTMTGPVTNTYGFYGNGAALTNIPRAALAAGFGVTSNQYFLVTTGVTNIMYIGNGIITNIAPAP